MGRQVQIRVNVQKDQGKQEHLWRYIGYDECNYTYIPEGKELLSKFGKLKDAPYYIRTHFMFCTGNCHGTYKFGSTNIYWENENGEPVYDFTYYDKILDAILETGNKPFLELGFMPKDLADKGYLPSIESGSWEEYNQYKEIGWTCPPKSYEKWHAFIKAVAEHLLDRYGEKEVSSWYYELWNEPDIFYWSGTAAEYCRLFDYTENALHSILPEARLSGPAVTGIFEGGRAQRFFRFFLGHCKEGANYCTQKQGTRLDFITFHVKGGGFPFKMHAEKAVPSVESLVHQVKLGLDTIVEYGYENCEVVLSEADPDGWAAGGIYDNANMRFRNTEYYATYVASTYEKIDRLSEKYGILVRPLAWAFMFPGERCFEGTRTFTTQGIDKAVFNMFKIYSELGSRKLSFSSTGTKEMDYLQEPDIGIKDQSSYTGEGEETEISGLAVKDDNGQYQIVLYSHCNDIDKVEENAVLIEVEGLKSGNVKIMHYRIDADHSNAYAEWVRQEKPLFPSGEQYEAIKAKDQLEKMEEDKILTAEDGKIQLRITMPAHAVSYFIVEEK